MKVKTKQTLKNNLSQQYDIQAVLYLQMKRELV